MGRKVVVLTIDQKREIYNYKKKYSAPSNQSIYETVDVAHSSNFLGMLNECGIPPSYANDQEIEYREIELELETSRESLKSFTLLN